MLAGIAEGVRELAVPSKELFSRRRRKAQRTGQRASIFFSSSRSLFNRLFAVVVLVPRFQADVVPRSAVSAVVTRGAVLLTSYFFNFRSKFAPRMKNCVDGLSIVNFSYKT